MPRIPRRILIVLLLAASGLAACKTAAQIPPAGTLELAQPGLQPAAFERALAPIPIELPRDHGPHEPFQTEWWYYTGNLQTADGRRFGYQLTIFRRGLSPGYDSRPQGFATNQVYFAHLALTDVLGGEHLARGRFSRGAAGLAGGSGEPFQVWLEDWSIESLNSDGSKVHLLAADPTFSLDLELESRKPITLHGDRGLSAKGVAPGNASYYLSYTRMQTTGSLTLGSERFTVQGSSWFDHEWSTSALDAGDVGWDWFGLQLSDGRDLMLYWIRRTDGTFEPASGGTLVEADGTAIQLDESQVRIQVESRWTSPVTGAVYPAAWQVDIPAYRLSLRIEPLLADQENRLSFTYWEGAVSIQGISAGTAVQGVGYVELTGYDGSMGGVF